MGRSSTSILSWAAWAILVSAGVVALARHGATPGLGVEPTVDSVMPSAVDLAPDRMTLLMFIHPRCPCTAASIEELSVLLAEFGSRLHAVVVVDHPAGQSAGWGRTSAEKISRDVPDVQVRLDVGSILTKKWGARTSGQVFLYGADGRLVFEGGITGSRGHVGANAGLTAVTKLVSGSLAMPRQGSAVFGCPIYSGEAAETDSFLTGVRNDR